MKTDLTPEIISDYLDQIMSLIKKGKINLAVKVSEELKEKTAAYKHQALEEEYMNRGMSS